ncbi:hypothetical protein QEV83_05490 [Methylocapsa sp. D3K7]|uniref:hypothetical protein n=1 Tax=Methylocapsa sp. D3K7 TaxID=3041435 RepID=UPI00244EFE92|nr:hypothetical protein [Methylocapsa sp. D3K7]WGJ15714.1 hypothetical protein QEV83_05490 [Methylocapsa sp. D3K7]
MKRYQIENRCKILTFVGTFAMSWALQNPAHAHEDRLVTASTGKVQLSVGFHIEPALFGTTNANDTFLYTYDKPCTDVGGTDPEDFVGAPIDVNGSNGDTVNLKVEVLILSKEKPYIPGHSGNPQILASKKITDISPLQENSDTTGLYNSWFVPSQPAGGPASGLLPSGTNAGNAYGFHIYGTVHAGANSYQCAGTASPLPIAARDATIDEYFVCGKGTRTPGDGHSCVEIPQKAP